MSGGILSICVVARILSKMVLEFEQNTDFWWLREMSSSSHVDVLKGRSTFACSLFTIGGANTEIL